MEVEAEIVEEEESPDAHMNITLSHPTRTRDVSVLGKFRETGAPICASLGAMRPVLEKLVMLLLRDVTQGYSKKVRHEIHLLKIDVKVISSYLDELLEVEDPPPTANSWMNEVCDLSYDMEDYINSLIFVHPEDPSLVPNNINTTRSLCKLFSRAKTPKTNFIIAETLSVFRMHILEAIERYQRYNLHSCTTLRRRFVSHGPVLLPTPYEETANIVIDGRMNKFINSLANDGDQQLKVISVLGSACLGKTTLATVLYNRFGKQYNCRAFIRVSKKPDTKRIFGDMLSQLQRQGLTQNCREIDIIENIKNYLRDKRYLIILDDVWAVSVWDIISQAFPNGSHGSRIITTTQIEDVALTCCYQEEHVFEMKPLDDDHSRKLFYNRLYGSESYCPEHFKEVSTEIVEICGGLPLATISIASLLASQPVITIDFMTYIYRSLSSCFSASTTSERLRQVLNLSYNNLPRHLKTCLLYLSVYPEGSTFYKDDLVKQWMAESLINTTEGQDIKEVATSYLDELIGRRFIQPICINYNNEVVSCTVHDALHDLIAHKSAEKNFIVAIAYSQMNVAFSHKVRRLSLQLGDTRYAKTPANIRKAQVRSLAFFGLIEFMPCISDFKLLCVLNLQLSDHGGEDDPLDLTSISELFQLRYLKIAGDVCIKLPKHGLQCLETLDITDARVDMDRGVPCVPYIHLPHLLHLSLSAEINLVKWIASLVSDGKL